MILEMEVLRSITLKYHSITSIMSRSLILTTRLPAKIILESFGGSLVFSGVLLGRARALSSTHGRATRNPPVEELIAGFLDPRTRPVLHRFVSAGLVAKVNATVLYSNCHELSGHDIRLR